MPESAEDVTRSGFQEEPTRAFATLGEIYAAAKSNLDAAVWEHLDGGAGEDSTVRANRQAFAEWQFRPRILTGIDLPDTRTTFLGLNLSMPVLTAPFGSDALFHPDGQVAVARANARFGTVSIVPGASSFSLEEIAANAPTAARIFQLHSVGSSAAFLDLARRAKDSGYEILCVTADCPTRGWRDRLRESRFSLDVQFMRGNYSTESTETLAQFDNFTEQVWTWAELADVCAKAGMPFIVKGVLTAEDGAAAVAAGAKGILVSNHGGRQIDGAPASLDQLPEIVAEVGPACAVALDSGIRRGTDILKALALGAQVVVIGRAAAMGLAARGESGVHAVLELLQAELKTTMALVGVPTSDAAKPSFLQRSTRASSTDRDLGMRSAALGT